MVSAGTIDQQGKQLAPQPGKIINLSMKKREEDNASPPRLTLVTSYSVMPELSS
jgi:hypothetical protein